MSVISQWLFVIGYLLLVIYYQLAIPHPSATLGPITNFQLPIFQSWLKLGNFF